MLRTALGARKAGQHVLQNSIAAGAIGCSQLRFLQSSDGPKAPPTPQVCVKPGLRCLKQLCTSSHDRVP